jgi:hypothetical protein
MADYLDHNAKVKLQAIAAGQDVYGRTVTLVEQSAAISALYKMDRDLEGDILAKAKQEEEKRQALAKEKAEQDRIALEQQKLNDLHVIESRRLDIESQRVQIEQAQVVVKLLETVAQAGVGPDKLLEAFQTLTEKLLPGPISLPAHLQISDKTSNK